MELSSRFAISPQVVAREVGDETVILDLASGAYFGLDPIGTQIWRLIEGGKSIGEACAAIMEDYEVLRETLEKDVMALLCDLEDKKLVSAI